jgi:sec-independent protein translocase protein TatC
MTEASVSSEPKARAKDDPEQYRMSLGDHLEELRSRMIMALVGFGVIFLVCLFFGNKVVEMFCAPLTNALQARGLNPIVYYNQMGEPFMVFIRISLITAAAFAAPWMLYQLWLFIAAGLYPEERKYITRYIPLSITLLISGMLFVYFLVLPWSIDFFIGWGNNIPLPQGSTKTVVVEHALPMVPMFAGDPVQVVDGTTLGMPAGTMWINTLENKLKIAMEGGVRALPFTPTNLLAPQITLATYINLVVLMLIMFGLAFQLPLAVMAVARIGLVQIETLRSGRKVVYFGLLILASAVTPGDVITATIALLGPLILLYEFGIIMAARGIRKSQAAAAAAQEEAEAAD